MKHTYTDEELQVAIDEACQKESCLPPICEQIYPTENGKPFLAMQKDKRLQLARSLPARLPEPTPPAVDGKTPGHIAYCAFFYGEKDRWDRLLDGDKARYEDSASAVLTAFGQSELSAAIAKMEAVTDDAMIKAYWEPGAWTESVRNLFIGSAKEGQQDGINWKAKFEEAQAKLDYVHAMGLRFGMMTSSDKLEPYLAHTWTEDSDHERMFREWSASIGWEGWQARAEKAEAELARVTIERNHAIDAERSAHRNAKLPQLRPLAEAGDVPEGCVRFTGYLDEDGDWTLGNYPSENGMEDTDFVDIRLPAKADEATPDPYAELKKALAEGKVIQYKTRSGEWADYGALSPQWNLDPCLYRIKPEPATFEAHGKTWTRHTPGDPCPVDGDTMVFVLFKNGDSSPAYQSADDWKWGTYGERDTIIGWRYADEPAQPETQEATTPEPWKPAVGDVVRLKSGGPKMTVVRPSITENGDPPAFLCEWFNASEEYEAGNFYVSSLKPAQL